MLGAMPPRRSSRRGDDASGVGAAMAPALSAGRGPPSAVQRTSDARRNGRTDIPAPGDPSPNVAPMELLLVRHAHAGAKDRWRGDDRLRPLSDRGREEARSLVDVLATYAPAQVVSSPLVRCVQTVEPVATRFGLPIELSGALGPQADRDAARLLRALASASHSVVVCTHGETIEALQRRLARPGKLAFGPGGAHEKGSVWLLHARGGRFTSATYLPPSAGGGVVGNVAVDEREESDESDPSDASRV